VIDLHCHVLPGIDDGPETVAASLAMARAAVAGGVRTLVATPHVSSRYPNRAETIVGLVDEVNERLAGEGVALEVLAGAEVAMTHLAEIEPRQLSRLRLGGGEWLLVEPPFAPVATALDAIGLDLQRRGNRIVLAHPERCAAFHRNPDMLRSLVRGGALTSITAGSLVGRFGRQARHFALELVREEMVHNVASDAHDLRGRPPGIRAELQQAGLAPLADWLTEAVPAAILGGREIPPRPSISFPRPKLAQRLRQLR
jgi:protein-tyrosine phosphatase